MTCSAGIFRMRNYDVNPNPDGGPPALDRGDILADAEYYRYTSAQARARYREIAAIVNQTRTRKGE